MIKDHTIILHGGIDEAQPTLHAKENLLLNGVNVEIKKNGVGYQRMLGYAKWDTAEVTDATYVGTGKIRGVAFFNGKCYAARNTSNDSKLAIFSSSGSGWTVVKHTLEPGGTYEFTVYSFGAVEKLYGVSGKNKAFFITAGTPDTYTEITTGLSVDEPAHIITHRNRLWLSYGASLLYSDVGDPTAYVDWTALSGELVMKGPITAVTSAVGGSLAAFSRDQLSYMSGTGAESTLTAEHLVDHGSVVGSYPYTVQQMGGRTLFLDDQGVMRLQAVEAYGGFKDATISAAMYQTIQDNKDSASASCVVRSKNQYRLFFSNGLGLTFSMLGDKLLGITKLSWPLPVNVVWSGEDASGDELILFGSSGTDGFIYQMESGNNFAGSALSASITTAFSACKRPRRRKRFRRAIFGIGSVSSASLTAEPIMKIDSSPDIDGQTLGISANSSYLGIASLGVSTLGGMQIQEGRIDIPVKSDYIAMQLRSSATTGDAWEIDSITYEFFDGGKRR